MSIITANNYFRENRSFSESYIKEKGKQKNLNNINKVDIICL